MIFKPASPVKCSTSGCNSSHISTSGKGNRTATSFRPNNSNFFVDFFAHLWYFSAIAALLSKKSSHPGLYPSPGREPLLFSSQISTKSGATSYHGSLGMVNVEYTSAVFKQNSPIVGLQEAFCSVECDGFYLNPHGRDVGPVWNGSVS